MNSSSIASILSSASSATHPIHVFGAPTPVQALLVFRYFLTQSEKKGPLLVICFNDDQAIEFCADLRSLASAFTSTNLRVRHFPTWDQSPSTSITLSLRTRFTRISILSSIAHEGPLPDVIVTTIPGASQATLPREDFLATSLKLEVNQSIESREDLIKRLTEAGYSRVDPAEDPGHFAIRGDILDVFSPDSELPYRIEVFGDLIERIRKFDPATQRVQADQGTPFLKITLPPAREVLINSRTSLKLREGLKNRADHLGIPRTVRDPILSSIREGIYPDHSDAWAPFAYEKPETLWDYLPSESPIFWIDEFHCQQEWDRFLVHEKKLSSESIQSQVICPSPELLFLWESGKSLQLNQKSKVYFDKINLLPQHANLEEDLIGHHRIVTDSNPLFYHSGSRHSLDDLEIKFRLLLKQGFNLIIFASTESQLERIRFLLEERHLPSSKGITLKIGSISEGFHWPTEGLAVFTENEILGTQKSKKQRNRSRPDLGPNKDSAAQSWSGLQALSDLWVGDAVVHVDHGIGRYRGLVRLDLSGAPSDFLLLEYAQRDKLYLPIYRLNVIQKYVGGSENTSLDRLGSQQFIKTKEKVKESIRKLAFDLVQLYAERKVRPGFSFSPRDAAFREFEDQFSFEETPDQLKAIDAVLSDMEAGKVMDRLVCGDVGYGKTEVAIRAAFRAVSDGKQVAVLVPTTLLAQQHELSFKTRLADYPLIIESISRFKNPKEQRSILEAASKGRVDILIGTHRLLSKDVSFHDLGIIIVDEEHRFGVEHKERLKTLKVNTNVLTLTATPIPRTLHMALSGLRDISLINTPPIDRLPIRTYVSKYDDALIQRAIEFELARGGQVFFLHNRVQSIFKTAARIRELVPTAQVIVGHGQMPEQELEDTMTTFYQKKANVLVCTTIIESGIDLPSANTMIIDRADSLGLAQLYQIRGRVGRSQQRAYAYLLIPAETAITGEAKKRLEVIQRFVELGSGFSIASHDLEIRGGGDILGAQQSGNIAAVGFDLYTELLEEAIREIQGKPALENRAQREPEIKVPFPAFLGEEYVPDVHQRLSLYRRFSAAAVETDLDRLEEEVRDRFGTPPLEAQNLIWLIRIKIMLKRMGIVALTVGPEKVSLSLDAQSKLEPARAIALISSHPDQYQLTPDSRLIAKIPTDTLRNLYFGLETLFKIF